MIKSNRIGKKLTVAYVMPKRMGEFWDKGISSVKTAIGLSNAVFYYRILDWRGLTPTQNLYHIFLKFLGIKNFQAFFCRDWGYLRDQGFFQGFYSDILGIFLDQRSRIFWDPGFFSRCLIFGSGIPRDFGSIFSIFWGCFSNFQIFWCLIPRSNFDLQNTKLYKPSSYKKI